MPTYRALRPIYVGGIYYNPGDTVSISNWVPPAAVDPLDTPAVNAFYAAGPQFLDYFIRSFVDNFNPAIPFGTVEIKPVTYWTPVLVSPFSSAFSPAFGPLTTNGQWVLTGLGSNQSTYPPIGI